MSCLIIINLIFHSLTFLITDVKQATGQHIQDKGQCVEPWVCGIPDFPDS